MEISVATNLGLSYKIGMDKLINYRLKDRTTLKHDLDRVQAYYVLVIYYHRVMIKLKTNNDNELINPLTGLIYY